MTAFEYLLGMALLLVGFNLGYYESDKGLTIKDLKGMLNRLRKHKKSR